MSCAAASQLKDNAKAQSLVVRFCFLNECIQTSAASRGLKCLK